MEHSESIGKIAAALNAFHELVTPVGKDAVNPFFKSKYATLENILETIKKPLLDQGLTVAQFPDGDGLTTMLLHPSGEWLKATMKIHMGSKAQEQGSALTYARRYALSAVLGLATEDDDDGNAASAPKAPQTAKTAPQRTAAEDEALSREKARKDRILANLKRLGKSVKTKEEIAQAVFDLVGVELVPEKFDEIGEALGKLR